MAQNSTSRSQREIMDFIIPLIPRWMKLQKISQNKLVRSSYFWLIATPVAAKILQPLAGKKCFELLDATWCFHLSLPFSVFCFYLAAVFFALATLASDVFCPPFLKEFTDFSVFSSKSKGPRVIFNNFVLLYQRAIHLYPRNFSKVDQHYFLQNFTTAQNPDVVIETGKFQLPKELESVTIKDACLPEAFDFVWNNWNRTLLFIRILILLLYVIGFVLVGIILYQNFMTVVSLY